MILGYCTNIHPAETWEETLTALKTHVLAVRDLLLDSGDQPTNRRYPIGLRLSAIAAEELLSEDHLPRFIDWLEREQCYVFTINGFPYGSFHGTRVKEKVFQPDWTDPKRVLYTKHLFKIAAALTGNGPDCSVSTLPGSHKSFDADQSKIITNLVEMAYFIEDLSQKHQIDLHLGLEPEPLGHFENTNETLQFFEDLHTVGKTPDIISKRIGLNYDTCHFAIEFDDAAASLDAISAAGIRLSKIHLSNALRIDPQNPEAIEAIRSYNEPTYFHQVIAADRDRDIHRFPDLPDFLQFAENNPRNNFTEARIHFHIPLDSTPAAPLDSTHSHVAETLAWCQKHPAACQHFEIETYTWGVLPENLQRPIEQQIAAEYHWVLEKLRHPDQ
ncbi:metabolite traffic protein EboE [Luteolibacter sp. AS25]|uniref:metabolite traffic protein EboE n=1 Tax=Luteolibacter sp. AS25 TaxID=3135776 RepID=UPI00398AAA25